MILVNGQPVESLDVRDRGLAYGDGVFRTLRAQAGTRVRAPSSSTTQTRQAFCGVKVSR